MIQHIIVLLKMNRIATNRLNSSVQHPTRQIKMKNILALSDKLAISLSFLCTLHCLVLPLALVLMPSLAILPFQDEAFHLGMLIAVIPISAFALTMGCKQHKRYQLLLMGGIGLSILIAAVILGHDLLGETGEKVLTVIGAGFVALGHIWNYRLCQRENECGCQE